LEIRLTGQVNEASSTYETAIRHISLNISWGHMKTLIALPLTILLVGCTLNDSNISSSAENYVRVTEYNASVPLYGGVQGCQVSTQGEVVGSITLSTENCEVTISE